LNALETNRIRSLPPSSPKLSYLQLLHLADSALPIGALAHSFGLETLASRGLLKVSNLESFLRGYLEETGIAEAVFCREAFLLAINSGKCFSLERWSNLNATLSAMKPARESRCGSAALGRNFLMAVSALGDFPVIKSAIEDANPGANQQHPRVVEHSPAFGLAAGALEFSEASVVVAYLHQSVASLVSACQRLLPFGQTEATRILWNLKPAMIETAERSLSTHLDDICCFNPLLDWGAMEHPALGTRLFIS
jgi:urease accessory protein